jgi:hypothetical protein
MKTLTPSRKDDYLRLRNTFPQPHGNILTNFAPFTKQREEHTHDDEIDRLVKKILEQVH